MSRHFRRSGAVAVVLVFTIAGVVAGYTTGTHRHRNRRAEAEPARLHHVATTERVVALSFDDGPDPRWTPAVLAELGSHGAHATFFLVGINVRAHPDLVRAELATGNEVADHTWDHAHLPKLSPAAIADEIRLGAEAIRATGAPRPLLFRPPIGLSNARVATVASALGFRTVFWDVSVEHVVNHDSNVAHSVAVLLSRVRPGSIILAHDGGIPDRSRTMAALPLLLDGLARLGYKVVSVGQLLHR